MWQGTIILSEDKKYYVFKKAFFLAIQATLTFASRDALSQASHLQSIFIDFSTIYFIF